MIYDVNANGDPNTVKQDIRTMNAPVLGSTCTDMVEISGTSYCIAFVASDNGTDCTIPENAVKCGSWYSPSSTSDAVKNDKIVDVINKCKTLGMALSSSNLSVNIFNALGTDYLREVSAISYENRVFVRDIGSQWREYFVPYHPNPVGSSYYSKDTDVIGVCYKIEQ